MCKFEGNHTTLLALKDIVSHHSEKSKRKIHFIIGQSLTCMIFSHTKKSVPSYFSQRIHFDKTICDVSDRPVWCQSSWQKIMEN